MLTLRIKLLLPADLRERYVMLSAYARGMRNITNLERDSIGILQSRSWREWRTWVHPLFRIYYARGLTKLFKETMRVFELIFLLATAVFLVLSTIQIIKGVRSWLKSKR